MNYKKLFFGFVFLFDLRLNGVDAMPDMLGYIFFYQGLNELKNNNSYFAKAKSFAFPMIFISILDIFQVNMINSATNSGFYTSIIIGIIITGINLLMVYNICFGVAEEARNFNALDLEEKALNRWKLYLVANILLACSSLLGIAIPILFFVISAVWFISYILMLALMKSAQEKFA